MRRSRPDPEVIAALSAWLEDAISGKVQAVFVVARFDDGTYDDQIMADEAEDMLFEVRSACIRIGCDLEREPH